MFREVHKRSSGQVKRGRRRFIGRTSCELFRRIQEGSTDDYEEEEEISSKVDSFESSSEDNSVVGSSSSVLDLTEKEPDYLATMTKS